MDQIVGQALATFRRIEESVPRKDGQVSRTSESTDLGASLT